MQIYVVVSGDTIYSIAQKFGTSAEKIATENEISLDEELVVGQTIVITGNQPKIGSLAVNGYLYPNIDREVFRKTLPYLTFITIFTYGFNQDGSLIYIDDDEILDIAREYNVAPIMLISTLTEEGGFSNELASAILNDTEAQDVLIENILENIRAKNYYGLDIDFEYVFPEDREAYVAFVNKVRERLNAEGYFVIVALAPKTSAGQQGLLYEAHDYRNLGQAANAVLLMTYEWGYSYGPPMAVAPINKVREVLEYAVTEIPPNRIFMGIPNYGYNWTLPYIRGESMAPSISNVEAVNLAREYGAEILFDEVAQSPYFYYTASDGAEHVVWFEDARSIYTKLMTAFEFGFLGVSYWNIMRFFPQNWLVLSQLFDIYKAI